MVLTQTTSVITGEIAPQDATASGISNMLRNLGTAVLATVITETTRKCAPASRR